MSKRTRVVIVVIVIELLLAGGWFWLNNLALTRPASPDATRVIGQTFGAVMGIVLALSPFLYMLARRNDLKGK